MTMEITDYLAVARRRWLLLVGVPLLAGAIAAAVLLTAPPTYTATATVNAPALVGGANGQYTGSQAVTQFVSAFESTAVSGPVDRNVFASTKVGAGALTDNLTVAQVGGSSAVTVTYVSPTKGQAVPVVKSVASATLGQMFDSQVTLAQSRADAALKQVSQANAAITAWGAKNGMVDPNRVYQSQLERLNSLQQSQASFKAQGNAAAASALSGSITDVSNTLKTFGPKIAEYSNLTAARDSATSDLTSARQSLAQSATQKTAADPARVVDVGSESASNRTDELVSVGVPVVGAGLFLALALIAVLELLRSNRVARRRESEIAAASSATAARRGVGTARPDAGPEPSARQEGDSALVGTDRS